MTQVAENKHLTKDYPVRFLLKGQKFYTADDARLYTATQNAMQVVRDGINLIQVWCHVEGSANQGRLRAPFDFTITLVNEEQAVR